MKSATKVQTKRWVFYVCSFTVQQLDEVMQEIGKLDELYVKTTNLDNAILSGRPKTTFGFDVAE